MKYLKLKFLLMFFALAMAIPPAWAETVTATLTQSVLELTGSYTTNTQKTVDGITYQYTDLQKNNDNIQAKASTGTIFNTTAYPGNITSVAITHSGTARATTILGSSDGANWSQVATGSGSITGNFSGKGYKYFKITRGSNAAYWTKIEITYQSGTVLEQVATPTFSPAAGTYTEVQNVEINCETEGATIYYTTDGSTPTITSTEYTGAITVNETMTLKAIAVKSGMDNSTVASATYTINLPVVPSGVIYKKVNSSNIKNGGTYVIIYEGDPAAAMGEIVTVPDNGTKGSSVTGIILDKTTTPHQVDLANKSALLLTARATNTEGRYAFEIGEGSYLKCKSASFDIADSYTNVTDAQWDVLGDGRVKSANTSSNRPIIYRAGNVNLFGPYAASNVNNTEYFYAYLYEKVDGSGVERVATPTFDPAGDAYDTPQSVTISCETPNSTIYYTTDGTDPTESSTLYNGAIEVNETMTIKAIAVADDMENSLVATATYTLPKFVANLTAANALPDNTNFKYTKDVVVVYRKNAQMWIQDKDGTEGGGFVYTSGLTFSQSDVINANWTAKKIKYSTNNTEYPEFTEFVGTASSTTQTPIAIERSALSTDNIHEYVLLKNVTISDDLNVTLGSRAQYQLYTDKLEEYTNFTPETGKTYDVKGLVGIYQNNLQIYPLEITEYVAPGEPSITITPPNVLPFNDEGGIYTVDGSNLPTDGLGVNVSNGFSRELLEGGNNEYYYFPTYNGAVDGRQTKVTYNGRELSATGTITYESGSANKSADLSYRADVYIIGNFSNAGWNYGDGSRPMTYNEGTKTYTYTLEDVPANSYIMFARKTDETYDWNTYPTYNGGNRLFFGAKTDNDGASWWYVSDATDDLVFEPSTVGQTKYSPIYFENAGTYTITINAANKTFTINKVVHQVATPVFDPEGGEYNTIQMVAITCETEGAVIHYTTDGTAPDANSPVYRDAITVDQSMTIKAIAVMDGMDNSEVAEATYTLPTSVKTVVAANALEKNTEFLFTGDAVVTYHNGDYTFLRDVNATAGGGLIYQSGINLAQGVVLKKGWDAKRDDYRGEKEYINAINVENSGTTADFTPFDRTGVAFADAHMNEYVTFNNVTITGKTLDEGSNKYTYTGTYTDGNRANVDYILHNQFDLNNIEEGRTYNVTGVVVKRDDNMQVYPTEVVEAPQVATPTITPNGGVFTAAQEVTIATTTEGAKLYYSLDGENWIEGSTLTVDHSGTVYAKATKAGMNDSEVAEATFTINYAPITITLEPASGEYTVGDEAKVKVTIANTVGTATVTYMTGETAETANTPVTPDEDGYITIPTTEAGTVVLKVTASDAYHAEPVIKTGTYTIEAKPYVTAVPASLDFVTVIGEEPVSKTFTVMAENLKGDITLTMTESNVFTITPATIAKADMTEEGVVVTVTYNPTAVTGDEFDKATVTITSTDADPVTVTLTGMAEDIVVALAAPTFSPAAGTYTEPKEVAIACATPGVTIMYSINGGTPQAYTKPFLVENSCIVTATASKGSKVVYNDSEATATYEIKALPAAQIDNKYYYLVNNALPEMYANVAGRRTLNFVADPADKAGTVFRVMTDPDTIGQVETLRSQGVDMQGYAKRAMNYVTPIVQMVVNKLNDMDGVDDATGTGSILGENGLGKILAEFNKSFDYHLYVEGNAGAYRIYARTPSMQRVVDFYNNPDNKSQIQEKLPMLEGYINQVLAKIRSKVPAGMNAGIFEDFSLVKVWEKMGGKLIKPEGDENIMAFYDQVLSNKEYVWDFAYQTAKIYLDNIKGTQTYADLDPEYKLYIEKMEEIRPETKFFIIQNGNELDYVREDHTYIQNNNDQTFWTLTERPYFTVNFPEENKYGSKLVTTLYTDFAYDVPEDVTAYKVTDIDANGIAKIADLGKNVPAQTPVLLMTDATAKATATTKNVTLNTTDGTRPDGNLLEGPDYLINKYKITSPTVEALFAIAAGIVGGEESDAYQTYVKPYEYLKLRTSGTVNNRYFWGLNSDDLKKCSEKNSEDKLDCVVRSLGVNDEGKDIGFYRNREALLANQAFIPNIEFNPILLEVVATPTFDTEAGTYNEAQTVTITCETEGATIYYKMGDEENWTEYDPEQPINVAQTTTIQAYAVKDGLGDSEIAEATYTIELPAEAPTFNPVPGSYEEAQDVTIIAPEGATVSYRIDGGEWQTYTEGEEIHVDATQTIEAKVVMEGMSESAVATGYYVIDIPEALPTNMPVFDGYYSILNSGKYANVQGRKTLTFTTEPDAQAGTVIRLKSDNTGKVEVLRSQAADLQRYAYRALDYVPDIVQIVVDKLGAEGEGHILGQEGLDAIMDKFDKSFKPDLYIEKAGENGYRIYGKTPSMQPVVDFYRENKDKVEAKLPDLVAFINSALAKLRAKAEQAGMNGDNVFVDFDLKTIWERMGGNLTDPEVDEMGFYRDVLNYKDNVWNFAYQTATFYLEKIKNTGTYESLLDELGEYAQYLDKIDQIHPDFKYYIVANEGVTKPDFISEGNTDIANNAARTIWTIEPRENFTVNFPAENKLGDEYVTTLYTDFAYTLPEGVTAWAVESVNEYGIAKLAKVDGTTIAAQTPVLLKSTTAGDVITFKVTTAEGIVPATNELVGPDYLIETYQIMTPEVVKLFEAIKSVLGENIYNDLVEDYGHLQLRNSGTVNNKYFWGLNEEEVKSCAETNPETGKLVKVVRSLGIKDDILGFNDNEHVYTNKALLVSTEHSAINFTLRGDINRDGQITIADVPALIDILLVLPAEPYHEPSELYPNYPKGLDYEAADFNENGEITIHDVSALIDYLLGV